MGRDLSKSIKGSPNNLGDEVPLYSYSCDECEHTTDIQRSFEESSIEAFCEVCGKIMTRQWGNIGIQFNGSGFYSTDNRKK